MHQRHLTVSPLNNQSLAGRLLCFGVQPETCKYPSQENQWLASFGDTLNWVCFFKASPFFLKALVEPPESNHPDKTCMASGLWEENSASLYYIQSATFAVPCPRCATTTNEQRYLTQQMHGVRDVVGTAPQVDQVSDFWVVCLGLRHSCGV